MNVAIVYFMLILDDKTAIWQLVSDECNSLLIYRYTRSFTRSILQCRFLVACPFSKCLFQMYVDEIDEEQDASDENVPDPNCNIDDAILLEEEPINVSHC